MKSAGHPAVVALILARGGSKGVPRKNLRLVGGKSLVRRAVECGRGSKRVALTVVSTDDEDIAREAIEAGAVVVRRPPALASDEASSDAGVIHAVAELYAQGRQFEVVVLLQPTSPLRTSEDVDRAVDALLDGEADTVVSVCEVGDCHPARMYTMTDGFLTPYSPESPGRRRQDLPPVYHRNGAIYCAWVEGVLSRRSIIGPRIGPYQMPRCRSVNIDEEIDLKIAETLIDSIDEHQR